MPTTASYPSDLTDAQWKLLRPLLPEPLSNEVIGGRPVKVDYRSVINGILYLNRSGCQWRMLPPSFGHWNTVYGYFRRWKLDGTWEKIHNKLREKVRRKAGKKPTPSAAIIDSQSVKTNAPQKGGATGTTRARKPLAVSGISASIHSV